MLTQDLTELLDTPVMMILATRDAALQPAIARALGGRARDGGGIIDVLVSRWQWHEAIGGIAPGDPVAVTFVEPEQYRAYQVKGTLTGIAPADQDGHARVADYIARISQVLTGLGVARRQIERWLSTDDLVCLTIRLSDVFDQTPGPRAGMRLAAA